MKDKEMQVVFQQIRDAFNSYRTHIRKNYPENYKSLKENEEDKWKCDVVYICGIYII